MNMEQALACSIFILYLYLIKPVIIPTVIGKSSYGGVEHGGKGFVGAEDGEEIGDHRGFLSR